MELDQVCVSWPIETYDCKKQEENISVFLSNTLSALPELALFSIYLILWKLLKREEAIIHYCKFGHPFSCFKISKKLDCSRSQEYFTVA